MSDFTYHFSLPVPVDDDGYLGRECPECNEYFKLVPGTGLKDSTDCICPYCGYKDHLNNFSTEDQRKYGQSIALRDVVKLLRKQFTDAVKNTPRRSSGFSLEVNVSGSLPPVNHYKELEVETRVTCNRCTLKYAVYGVYGFCPDCGVHNSPLIADSSLNAVLQLIHEAETSKNKPAEQWIRSALIDTVSAFDGFGREICRLHADKATDPKKVAGIRFQDLEGTRASVQECFGFDISAGVTRDEWEHAVRYFQRRHVIQHNSGVIDDKYIKKANDPSAVKGRKVKVVATEVVTLVEIVRGLVNYIMIQMEKLT
jgi:hypothetical protein